MANQILNNQNMKALVDINRLFANPWILTYGDMYTKTGITGRQGEVFLYATYTVGCDYLSLTLIPAPGTQVHMNAMCVLNGFIDNSCICKHEIGRYEIHGWIAPVYWSMIIVEC